jgi:hypothetical protein
MNASSVDVKDILIADSTLGLVFATSLFVGKEPSKPDNCVTIFDTPGFPPLLGLETNGYEYPSVQIRVRNTTYLNGWNLVEKIKASLHGRAQQWWNGTLYSVIYCASGPAFLDWDDNGNARFIINFNLQRR